MRKGYQPNDPGLKPSLPPHVIRVIPDENKEDTIRHMNVEEQIEVTSQPSPYSYCKVEDQKPYDLTPSHSYHGQNMSVHPNIYEQRMQDTNRDLQHPLRQANSTRTILRTLSHPSLTLQ